MDDTIDTLKKVKESRNHKVTNSLGMAEAYSFFRKHRKDITSTVYRKTIRLINSLLQEQLANGEDIHLPCRMGILELRKFAPKITFEDNKLVTNLPVDWDRTLKLWCNSASAKDKKTLVRIETPFIYRVHYRKYTANYNNKAFYEFHTNRELKKAMKRNIDNNKIDAFTFKLWKQRQSV